MSSLHSVAPSFIITITIALKHQHNNNTIITINIMNMSNIINSSSKTNIHRRRIIMSSKISKNFVILGKITMRI